MNKVLSHDDIILTFEGYDLYAPDTTTAVGEYYYGVIETEQRPEPPSIDFNALTRVVGGIPSGLSVPYPDQVGFIVLCIPFASAPRRRWWMATNNKGPIGGGWQGPEEKPVKSYFNLFPDPEPIEHNGVVYRVYVSTYPTRVKRPIVFYS